MSHIVLQGAPRVGDKLSLTNAKRSVYFPQPEKIYAVVAQW